MYQKNQNPEQPQTDRIITFVSMSDFGGVHTLSREEFLQEHPDCWQELLRSGVSMYLCANGQTIDADKAIIRMMTLAATQSAKRHLEESLLEHFSLKVEQNTRERQSQLETRVQRMREEIRSRARQIRTA